VLLLRKGLNMGNRSFFIKLPIASEAAELIEDFLLPYYSEHEQPSEILTAVPLADPHMLEEALFALTGKRIKIVLKPRGERARWVDMAQRTAQSALQSQLAHRSSIAARNEALASLLGLSTPPTRIECFDISHTMGEATVASCVVFGEEGPLKADYRRFNIEGITGGDDFAAMQQALTRRYTRLAAGEGKLPEVLLIDGGKGQLQQAIGVLDALQIKNVLMVGVAKGPERRAGFERLFIGPQMREVFPGPESLGGHLIQQIRDEAHRFAITGHRARRGKARVTSSLEDIAGIGAKRRSALLKHFGGLQGLKRAGVEELAGVPGINRELAQRIRDALN
jgi:excinuclease ABC subunit C